MKRFSSHFLLILLITLLADDKPASGFAEGSAKNIDLVIQFDNDFEKHYSKIRYSKNMTVLQAMQQMQKHPHSTSFKTRGKGKLTFLYELDSIANQGNGRNWIYYVNGQRATIGIGARILQPGDRVLWKFETYQ